NDLAESSPVYGHNSTLGADVFLIEISPPDEQGFCSFGASVWDKRRSIETAKIVLGEVNPRMIRTYGENWCHVTEFDYFVHNEAPTGWGFLTSPREAPEHAREIADLVSSLVHDHDNMVAINQGFAIDFTGQITAEGLGSLQWSGPGGQPIMAIGAQMARNGRYILVLPSTAKSGQVSRILPTLPEGTPITVTRNF